MSNGPIEPSANMREMARVFRDMYVALTLEGFTTAEAMQIIGVTIASSIGGGKS